MPYERGRGQCVGVRVETKPADSVHIASVNEHIALVLHDARDRVERDLRDRSGPDEHGSTPRQQQSAGRRGRYIDQRRGGAEVTDLVRDDAMRRLHERKRALLQIRNERDEPVEAVEHLSLELDVIIRRKLGPEPRAQSGGRMHVT
jgi:hypothetical protein